MGGVGNLLAGVGQLLQQVAPVVDAAAGGLGTNINNGLQVAQNVTNAVGQMANGNAQAMTQLDKAQQNQEAAVVDRTTAESLMTMAPGQAKKGSGKIEPPGQARKGSGELSFPAPGPVSAAAEQAVADADFLATYPIPTPPVYCPPGV